MMIKKASLLVDAHVHLYDCFDPCVFFHAAYENLSTVASAVPDPDLSENIKILLLTETRRESGFNQLRQFAETKQAICKADESWYCERSDEAESLLLRSDSGKQLYIIAGRQIVCREGLEVHALATSESFDDGQPLVELIESINASGAVTALPWGAGKWLGKRGNIIASMKNHLLKKGVLLSDSGIRPSLWPASSLYKKELKVIAGTDPLPIENEVTRVGSYGFRAVSDWDSDRPAESVRSMLQDKHRNVEVFGRSQPLIQFLLRQIEIRR